MLIDRLIDCSTQLMHHGRVNPSLPAFIIWLIDSRIDWCIDRSEYELANPLIRWAHDRLTSRLIDWLVAYSTWNYDQSSNELFDWLCVSYDRHVKWWGSIDWLVHQCDWLICQLELMIGWVIIVCVFVCLFDWLMVADRMKLKYQQDRWLICCLIDRCIVDYGISIKFFTSSQQIYHWSMLTWIDWLMY